MPNLKKYICDLSGSLIRSVYLTREFAVLELEFGGTPLLTQFQINMNMNLTAKPAMDGELEKDPFLKNAFYLGNIWDVEQNIMLQEDNSLTFESTTKAGHEFKLEIPSHADSGSYSWMLTQGDFLDDRDVFFKCDANGNVTLPKENLPDSLWHWDSDRDSKWHNDEGVMQKLVGTRLLSVHNQGQVRLFFEDQNTKVVYELIVLIETTAKGKLKLNGSALKDQYRPCVRAIELCQYAEFLNQIVSDVTVKKNGNLILDFENETTLIASGAPLVGYCEYFWILTEEKHRDKVYPFWASDVE
ncbi:MAG: hypothetical protein IPG59_10445 [Candidatus Melainabacteria bacterium]|nr:MAG: hypothetical protein IPG59_10445 [Candidatus Melainabacteria bacterium]